MHRDQSGNCCQSGGHREHTAVSADAEVLEGKALGVEAAGKIRSFFTVKQVIFRIINTVISMYHIPPAFI